MKQLAGITVLATAVYATSVGAQPSEGALPLDSDGDGKVSLEEFEARDRGERSAGMLTRADADSNGVVTRDEMQLVLNDITGKVAKRMASAFDNMDSDNNGEVTRSEIDSFAFGRVDLNDDGFIDSDESARSKGERDRRMERRKSRKKAAESKDNAESAEAAES